MLQQMAAKGASPGLCPLVPWCFGHSSIGTRNRASLRDLGAQAESSVSATATASLSTTQ